MYNSKIVFGVIFITLIIVVCFFLCFIEYTNEETHQCIVEDKWVKRQSEKSDVYLVQCGDNVYKVSDLLFKGKFNSSDIYAKLKVGKKYEIVTTGYRFNLFSMYKNINDYKEIGD